MVPPGDITITPDQSAMPTPQRKPHAIPDDMDTMPPSVHQNTRGQPTVPQTYRYNIIALRLQVQVLMENYEMTIETPNPAPRNQAALVCLAGYYWAVINQEIGNLTL